MTSEQNTINEASKIIQEMQFKAIVNMPMWMRFNYLCNTINSMLIAGHTEEEIDWDKVNEILTTNVDEYDFNFFKRIETVEQLVWMAATCKASSICGEEIWQEHTCKDCGKGFCMTYNEVEFYKDKKLRIPKRCRICRNKRKEMKK